LRRATPSSFDLLPLATAAAKSGGKSSNAAPALAKAEGRIEIEAIEGGFEKILKKLE
jgi:hypothetical protein